MSNRLQQINKTLRHEISHILIEFAKEEWGIFTVTDVQIDPDLKNARIWISADAKIITAINKKIPEIRRILRPRITFKFIPNLKFLKEDDSISHIEELLEKIDET